MPKQTHEMNSFDSEMERRFQEETKRIQTQDEAVLDRFAEGHDVDEPGVLEGISRKWIGIGAVAASAAVITGLGLGKTTVGEQSPAQPNIPAMQDRANQIEHQNLDHAKLTGEPLISNRQ